MAHRCTGSPIASYWSYGTNLLYHLVADTAGLAGGQVAVVAFLQVDADLSGSLHLELVHSGTGLGDVDLVALVRHTRFLLFIKSSMLNWVSRG